MLSPLEIATCARKARIPPASAITRRPSSPTDDMKTLDVGLLVDSVHADKYVEELALWGKNQPHINISHLIVHRHPAARLALLPARAIWRRLLSVGRALLRCNGPHQDRYAADDLTQIIVRNDAGR